MEIKRFGNIEGKTMFCLQFTSIDTIFDKSRYFIVHVVWFLIKYYEIKSSATKL